MDIEGLYKRLAQNPTSIRLATLAVIAVWGVALVALVALVVLLTEQPGQTMPPASDGTMPAISLNPAAGGPGSTVGVQGEGWEAGSLILIYLVAPGQTETPSYAVAGMNADALGRFTTGFVVPSGPGWEKQGLATVVARVAEGGSTAQAFFSVLATAEEPTVTSEPPTPSVTPTELPPTPTAIPQPETATATALTDLNVRGGPGVNYLVLGVLQAGQSADITGISRDGAWWQIRFSGVADGRGWLAAQYVDAQHTDNVPVVQAPPAPPTPTPTPTSTPTPTPTSTPIPVVITDWRGEYYSNRSLSGAPVLVRNDVSIGFDWGSGSPGSGLSVDDFSVRWSRGLSFAAGTYRFQARVDDGVRLWVDGKLIIDQWHDSSPITYQADVYLSGGWHNLVMEYYERSGGALAQLSWESVSVDDYPDWKAEYYGNRKLEGDPVLVRNEDEIDHDWEEDAPGAGVPADNFSARWTQKMEFKDATYRFRVWVDDGVRLWVGDDLIIDSWKDGNARWIEAEREIDKGKHWVEVEYYEHYGDAGIKVSWERVEDKGNQPPLAVPGGPYSVDEGSLISFDGYASYDPDGSIATYEWDFDYSGVFIPDVTGATASTSYADGPATVSLALRVTDNEGATHTAVTQVEVRNVAPAVEAGGPYSGRVGSLITMAGSATDPGSVDQAGLSYLWDFGDGTQGSGPTVSHSYAQPGAYALSLTVTDRDGASGSDTATVRVGPANQPPRAVISGPTSGLVGETLTFDGSGSRDVDGSIINGVWDFGDGTGGDGVTVSHSYSAAGAYRVRLKVTDSGGLSDIAVHWVQISPANQPPQAVISGPASGLVGEALTFDASGSGDSDGAIVSYAWELGDGTTGSGTSVSHSYAAAGTYQVKLTVADDGGLSDNAMHTVQVSVANQPPAAAISGPASGLVGEALTFDAGGSGDSDGAIVSYAWELGDGTTGSGTSVSHSYGVAGTYQVRLTVTDDGGLSDSATHKVQVSAPNQPPAAAISGPASGRVGELLSFNARGSHDVDGSIVSGEWDFGDGAAGTGVRVAHTYMQAGLYQVRLTVTDDGGLTSETTHAVLVSE
jgi:PKD repeat protein